MKTIKLGSTVKDTATGLIVTPITLHVCGRDGSLRQVNVQPRGLDPKTGQPANSFWATEDRLGGTIEGDIPHYLIGTKVEDTASGFKGEIVSLVLHINGCLHANVQAPGTQKNGDAIAEANFDIRRLKGPAIKKFTEAELAQSIRENPSPVLYQKYTPKA